MEIRLYKNLSEKERVSKELKNEYIISGNLNNDCSLVSPEFVLELESLPDYNYMYVPSFGRYYFIGNPTNLGGYTWLVPCEEDYLSTWWDSVKNNRAIIARQETDYNLYLNDPDWKVYANKQILTRTFPKGFAETGNYYLTVVGGYDNIS